MQVTNQKLAEKENITILWHAWYWNLDETTASLKC